MLDACTLWFFPFAPLVGALNWAPLWWAVVWGEGKCASGRVTGGTTHITQNTRIALRNQRRLLTHSDWPQCSSVACSQVITGWTLARLLR